MQNQQLMLLLIERKWGKLRNSSEALIERLKDPNASRIQIQSQFRDNSLEMDLLQAKHDQIENGSGFNFPDENTVETLRKAISNMDTVIAKTAAIEDLIQASSDLVSTMEANTI